MLNRGQLVASLEDTAAAVSSAHIDRHPGLINTHTFPQPHFPTIRGRGGVPGGMAGRRQKPGFSLRDIDPSLSDNMSNASAAAAGLGAGHPSLAQDSRRPSQGKTGTPFANFSKIVYVSCLLASQSRLIRMVTSLLI